MTVIGLHVASRDRVLIWTDSEYFIDRKPAGHANKLILNPTLGIAAIGTGRRSISLAGSDCIAEASSFYDVVNKLPAALSRKSSMVATECFCPSNSFAVTGFDKSSARMVAFRFDAPNYFAVAVRSISAPWSYEIQAMNPQTLDDITGVAQMQLADLRRRLPGASGGDLIGAVIRPGTIETRRLGTFDSPLRRIVR